MIKENQKAPEFCLKDSYEKDVCLSDFAGKKVVLYFYPKDNTPGCTIEALDFTALQGEFEKLNTVVVGVSKDSCQSHRKFVDKKNLAVTLLSDPDSEMQKKYNVWRMKKFMGREYMGTVRSTVLIDEKGVILKIWDGVKAKGHADDVLSHISGSE